MCYHCVLVELQMSRRSGSELIHRRVQSFHGILDNIAVI
jgi:hypothetical protein